MLVIDSRISIPLREINFSFSRSSGPGGQNVNKVNTKVQLRWNVQKTTNLPDDVKERFSQKYHRRITGQGELLITSQRFRDQGQNVADCLNKLREMITSVATPPRPRKRRKISKRAKELRMKEKRTVAEKKRLRRPPSRDE